MDTDQPAGRRRPIAIVAAAGLACLAIAIPVSGAFGADSSGTEGNASGTSPAQTQGGQDRQRGTPDHPCPKDRGSDQGGSDSSAPAPSGDSVAL
jgi:hypothetical protein